ncbi:hypothetical protein KCU76_g56, partial [Aureobasidium melanogenum]
MNPFQNFSFDKSAARAHSQLPDDETATHKKPKLSPIFKAPAVVAKSPSIKTGETTVKESITSAPAVPSLFASGVGADANASRAFFGLSQSNFKTRSSSLFSSIPSAAPAQKTPGSIFQFTPSKETAAGDQTTSSWFSSMRPSRQDTNVANTTSLFSSLPKTTIGAGSAFSKTSMDSSQSRQQELQAKSRLRHRNIFGVVPGTSSLGSGLAKSDSKMSNERLTTQSVMKSSLTGQGDAPGCQRPSQLFSNLTAGLLEPNNIAGNKVIANSTVNEVARENYKPASLLGQQSNQTVRHDQEIIRRIGPSEPMPAQKANPLQSKDTPNASIFGKAMAAASEPVTSAFQAKTKSSLFPSPRNRSPKQMRTHQCFLSTLSSVVASQSLPPRTKKTAHLPRRTACSALQFLSMRNLSLSSSTPTHLGRRSSVVLKEAEKATHCLPSSRTVCMRLLRSENCPSRLLVLCSTTTQLLRTTSVKPLNWSLWASKSMSWSLAATTTPRVLSTRKQG